jgi:hypothetical protein
MESASLAYAVFVVGILVLLTAIGLAVFYRRAEKSSNVPKYLAGIGGTLFLAGGVGAWFAERPRQQPVQRIDIIT